MTAARAESLAGGASSDVRPWAARRRRHRSLAVGAGICVLLVGVALAAPWLSPSNPSHVHPGAFLAAPSSAHLLGTDDLGRDVLSRLLFGSRVVLVVGFTASAIATALGVGVGMVAGYRGGVIGQGMMAVVDTIYAFPVLVLAVVLIALLGSGSWQLIAVLGFLSIPRVARLVRGQTIALREREYIDGARSVGAGATRILLRHLLPNLLGVILLQASLLVSNNVLTEASLSFLGLGVQPPTPTWGGMLRYGYGFLERAPLLSVAPGAAIALTVFGFNLLSDGLRDYLDPRLRRLA